MLDWFDKEPGVEIDGDKTNGDFLRALIENLYKAITKLLAALGEWPIDFE